jgi:O-succinylhomoserine sulfhydrylase
MGRWRDAIKPGTRAVFLESPSNPGLAIIDIAAIAAIAHERGACVVVDNIFATPILQKPLTLGADVVVYSGTKHMDGQGRVLGGAIVSTAKFKEEQLKPFLRHTGPSLSPFNAWVLLKGMETLKLRVEAQSAAALACRACSTRFSTAILRPLLPAVRCRAAAPWSRSTSPAARRRRSTCCGACG